MIDSGGERHFGRLEGVVSGEVDGEEKDTALVGALWGSHDGRLPMEQIVADGAGTALSWGVTTEVLEFFVDSFECHFVVWCELPRLLASTRRRIRGSLTLSGGAKHGCCLPRSNLLR